MSDNEHTYQNHVADIAIVGGGLAGLISATILAKAGRNVVLIEKSKQPGGRARSQQRSEFTFNLGPHALYVGGGGSQVLDELNIPYIGKAPRVAGYAYFADKLHLLPVSTSSLLRTTLLTSWEKFQLIQAQLKLQKTDPATAVHLTVAQWVKQITKSPRIQQLFIALSRLSTYANAANDLSAAIFLEQMQLNFSNGVLYLDGGWQLLIDGLYNAARAAGVKFMSGSRATAVTDTPHISTVKLAGGQIVRANAVVMAVDPRTAARLVSQNKQLAQIAATAVPIRAATLDVALKRLPRPENSFSLGIDQPLYYSLHSAAAKLGPAGSGMLHVAKYLPHAKNDPEQDKQQLQSFLDLIQPGWQEEVVEQRFLPNIVVVNDMAKATAANGGLAGRPGYAVAHTHNLYLAGDWVGPHGWLADASLVSARRVAELLLEQPVKRPLLQSSA